VIYRAGRILARDDLLLDGGALFVERGRIRAVLRSSAAIRRARTRGAGEVVDLGDGLLVPGLVDAHAHLELSDMRGALPGDRGFAAWLRSIVPARRARSRADFARSVESGTQRLLETGTTTVGDIVSTEGGLSGRRRGLRGVLYREVLDVGDPARLAASLAFAGRRLRSAHGLREGISPHAPYTTSRELLARAAALARRRALPVAVHWEESSAEREWLEHGRGELARLLRASPRAAGLELLREAGLLGPRTALVHGNHPRPRELAAIAAAGSVIVHCPGTHRFFGREPFPWSRIRRAGIAVALGTDSLASNEDLDVYREMRLFRSSTPGARPADVWAMATTSAARALGLEAEIGALLPGRWADFVLHRFQPSSPSAALERLTCGEGAVVATYSSGRERYRRTPPRRLRVSADFRAHAEPMP
jgi:cytosine/adenosine deaminase-related metal-dependent hydrolase